MEYLRGGTLELSVGIFLLFLFLDQWYIMGMLLQSCMSPCLSNIVKFSGGMYPVRLYFKSGLTLANDIIISLSVISLHPA